VRSVVLVDACLLGECASTFLRDPGKHTVTHAEPFGVAANGNNFACEFVAQHKRKPWPQDCAKLPLSELEIYRVQTRSAYCNENIAWPRRRCRDIHQQRAIGTAIMLENVCAHESPRSGRTIASSPAERELTRNQVVCPYGRFTLASVARMSEAISGASALAMLPAYRCAQAGYLLRTSVCRVRPDVVGLQ
jgi:hypothetical protein